KIYRNFDRKIAAKGVSIVICCHNSSGLLPETLRHISMQKVRSYVQWETIVVDNASTDNTAQAALNEWSKYGKSCKGPLRVVKQPVPGLSAAREKGIEESKYEYIIFCDDDNWLDENYLQNVVTVMRDNKKVAVIGCKTEAVCEIEPPVWFDKWKNWSYAVGDQADKAGDITWSRGFVWGAGMVLRKEALNKLYPDGFKSLLTDRKGKELASGGDTELCYALRLAGWRIWYEPKLTLKHYMTKPRLTWQYFLKLWKGFGISTVGLDTYLNIIPKDMIEGNYVAIKKDWKENYKDTRAKLKSIGLWKTLNYKRIPEGDPDVPLIVFNLARLKELKKIKKIYDSRASQVNRSGWKKEFFYLRLQNKKYKPAVNHEDYSAWPWVGKDSNDEIKVAEDFKISILTPSYYSGDKLEKSILSVLHQNYHNFEHIIVDGGSKDDTLGILKKYPHLKWVSEPDSGQSDAMNKAFKMCTGEIICYLNADDYFEPLAFKKIIRVFNEKSDVDMVVGNLILDKKDTSMVIYPEIDYKKIMLPFYYSFPINPVSYFYKKKVQEDIGEFPLDNHYTMDYWFLLQAYQKNKIHKIEEILGIFCLHEVNKTSTADNSKNTHETVIKHLKENDMLSFPYYLNNYYRNKIFRNKNYSSKKSGLRYLKLKYIRRIRFSKDYSENIFIKAKDRCYNNHFLKGFLLLNFSGLVYPPSIFKESRRSLFYRTVFGHSLVEKGRKYYYKSIIKRYEIKKELKRKIHYIPGFSGQPVLKPKLQKSGILKMVFSRSANDYSEELFETAHHQCYNYQYLQAFINLNKSFLVQPFSIFKESRRSLMYRSVLGHSLIEKLRKNYYNSIVKVSELKPSVRRNPYSGYNFFQKIRVFFRDTYYFFRYRKFKVYSENNYLRSQENFMIKKRLKSFGLLIISLLLYPFSIFKQSRQSLLFHIITGNSSTGKLKGK
ncbi:MAG: glycosyltransferase, partial [Ignavibacteria bacterium]